MGVGEECVLVHPQIPELRIVGSPEAGVTTELINKPPLQSSLCFFGDQFLHHSLG